MCCLFDYGKVFIGCCNNSRLSSLYGISLLSLRSGVGAAPLTTCALVRVLNEVLVTNVASAVFARCLVMVDKSFGLTFTTVLGALESLVFYSIKGLEGNQTGSITPPWW